MNLRPSRGAPVDCPFPLHRRARFYGWRVARSALCGLAAISMVFLCCAGEPVRLLTLDPGHFHAALVQKFMYPDVAPLVHVYAPPGQDLEDHLKRIQAFNSRSESPTHWQEQVYTRPNFVRQMMHDRAGNVVVLAGNNTRKTRYIYESLGAGFNVLADKPMAINPSDFVLLRKAFARAAKRNVLLFDIMTERFEVTTMLQRELAGSAEIFGKLQPGTPEHPAVEFESVHYFLKEVDGKPLIRPAWFFDVGQEGEAIPDVGTHLVDLVQWECFPGRALDWRQDVRVFSARRWPTAISPEQFSRVTGLRTFPEFLRKDVDAAGVLHVFGNGEVRYALCGVHVRVAALWEYAAVPGAKDSLNCILRGTRASVAIRQTANEQFQPTVCIRKNCELPSAEYEKLLRAAVTKLQPTWPGLDFTPSGDDEWKLLIPEKYTIGHEAHFAEVTKRFLEYLHARKLPEWEVPNMLAKYYTTTEAFRLSHQTR